MAANLSTLCCCRAKCCSQTLCVCFSPAPLQLRGERQPAPSAVSTCNVKLADLATGIAWPPPRSYAVGGGHILHMMCDLTIAADNAVFGQTGPKVGSFDAGYGSTQVRPCWRICCLSHEAGGRWCLGSP